jgi:hypothetical protein
LDNQKQLEVIQESIEKDEVSPTILQEEQIMYQKYLRSLKKEEELWRLKSRSLWLQADDKNTFFFHK